MVNFDVNLSIGRWPFRPLPHADMPELTRHLAKYGISGGLVRSAEGAFSCDPEAENERLLAACKNFPGFIPLPVADPRYSYWKAWKNVPAAVLYPAFHSYKLLAPETLSMARHLASAGTKVLAIVVREEDERAQHPLCRVPGVWAEAIETFAWNFPGITVIALNCYYWEPLIFTAPNLYSDLAFAESFPALGRWQELLKRNRVLFGSHSPFFCTSAALSKVEALSPLEQAAMQEAAERIFG